MKILQFWRAHLIFQLQGIYAQSRSVLMEIFSKGINEMLTCLSAQNEGIFAATRFWWKYSLTFTFHTNQSVKWLSSEKFEWKTCKFEWKKLQIWMKNLSNSSVVTKFNEKPIKQRRILIKKIKFETNKHFSNDKCY